VSLVLLALLIGVVGHARADEAPPPVEVRAHAEPDKATIGTRFRYVVEVTSAPDAEVFVEQPAERLGDFDIVDFGVEPPVRRDGRTLLRRWYRLVGYSPGDHLIKSPPVKYRVAGAEEQEAPAEEITVAVESLLGATPNVTDIRDIKAPEPVPVDWRRYYLLGGGVALLLAVVAILYRLLNRPRRARPALPPRPPHEIAGDALADLKRRNLVAAGALKEYYSTLSDIVRTYLEQRFRLRAPEMTTEEFLLTTAREGRLEPAHRRLLGEFLSESDLVKFARHLPAIADSERAWAAAQRFVDETAPAAIPVEERRAAG
jgi:hypothetical protein